MSKQHKKDKDQPDERYGVDRPVADDHPADVQGDDAERPLAERVEIAAGFPPKRYGERD